MIKISVIIPVYNAARHIKECLDSVLSQSLKDIEAVCIDDGSTDNSSEIIKTYIEKDKRVKLLTQNNQGAGPARNNGIINSGGEFIAFMDPDDLYPERATLEKLYDNAVCNNVNICGGSFSWLNTDGNINTVFENNYSKYTFERNEKVQYSDYQFDYGYHRFIYKRDLLIKNNIFFPALRRFQDPPFFIDAMLAAGEFYALKDVTYRYRNGYKTIAWTNEQVLHLLDGITYNLKTALTHKLYNLYYLTFDRFVKDFIPKLSYIRTWRFFCKLLKIRLITDRKKVDAVFYRKFRRFIINVFFETILSVKSNPKNTIFTLLGIQVKFKKKEVVFGQVVKIALLNNQGFGDCLMEAAFWKDVKKQVPNISIDYYTRNSAAFSKDPLFNKTEQYNKKINYKDYDLVMLNDRLYKVKKYNKEKIKLRTPLLAKYVDSVNDIVKSISNMNYALIAGLASLYGKNRRGHFDLRDIFSYDINSKPFVSWDLNAFSVLDRYNLKNLPYITISRACDGVFKNGHIKMWPIKHYNELVQAIKSKYPEIKIVQLGATKDYGSIDGVNLNLLTKTSYDELNVLLKHSLLHIDTDGGLMHLRNALYGSSCIVWGPTSCNVFGYENNINISSNICGGTCEYLIKGWQSKCALGFNEPPCIYSVSPMKVFDKVSEYIDFASSKQYNINLIPLSDFSENFFNILGDLNGKRVALFSESVPVWIDELKSAGIVLDVYVNGTGSIEPCFEKAFIYNIPRDESYYDAVFVNAELDLRYKEFALYELSRVLKSGGRCVVSHDISAQASLMSFGVYKNNMLEERIINE